MSTYERRKKRDKGRKKLKKEGSMTAVGVVMCYQGGKGALEQL